MQVICIFFNTCIVYQHCFILASNLHRIWMLLKCTRLFPRWRSPRAMQAQLPLCYSIHHFAKTPQRRAFLGAHLSRSGPEIFGHQAARRLAQQAISLQCRTLELSNYGRNFLAVLYLTEQCVLGSSALGGYFQHASPDSVTCIQRTAPSGGSL